MMKTDKKYIQYNEYLKTERRINNLKSLGFEFIHKKSRIKLVLGFVCLGVGIITLPLPTGSIFLIGFGLMIIKKERMLK